MSVTDGTNIYQVCFVCILFVNFFLTGWCKKKARRQVLKVLVLFWWNNTKMIVTDGIRKM